MDTPRISDAEWLVMKALWSKEPATAAEVIAAVQPDTGWSPKTIHTLLARLVSKGALEQMKGSRPYRYRPLFSQSECRMAETKSFVQKVYDGAVGLLVANLVKQERLTSEQLEELRRLLERD